MDWIKIEDSLPSENDCCLIVRGGMLDIGYLIEGEWSGHIFKWETCPNSQKTKPTHWMLTPEFPTEEEKSENHLDDEQRWFEELERKKMLRHET